ncbi:hypothetical protein [Candidatus Entotheonella palauensis]|uniref:hypothetical protein n=1 Tax=Candidatus Entotheonella palauensis TaxID=93172 RepID=UPI000B7DB747|nr:hypothetical protein [Candidatus Entotheonella palauensis]
MCSGPGQCRRPRLALLSIAAIGTGRSRGSGACVAEIDGEHRSPGTLLRQLHGQRESWKRAETADAPRPAPRKAPASASVVLRLVFRAHTPICCPEIPNIANVNVIETGFSIPASAVQGLILNRINARDEGLATGVFHSPGFRVWPLHPCSIVEAADDELPSNLPAAIRVSLTHRVAKFGIPETAPDEHFYDRSVAMDAYDFTRGQAVRGVPFKASDGVLLRGADGVQLWKASQMPHVITAHGVIRGMAGESEAEAGNGRNLFTVDAMAPMVWQGLVVLPQDAATELLESLRQDNVVAFGKSRSVRGTGVLHATEAEGIPPEWQVPAGAERTVLIAQSPLGLPDQTMPSQRADEELRNLAQGWADANGLPDVQEVWVNVGIRFGWNRHATPSGGAGRQAAQRVMLPGSVIALSERADDAALAIALQAGVGGGRERGFGAVSVHPGTATSLYEPEPPQRRVGGASDRQQATRRVLDMRRHVARLPSPSQIRAVQQRLVSSGAREARAYLKRQTERTSRIWFIWESIYGEMDELLATYEPEAVAAALEVLADLAIADQSREEN